MQALTRWWKNFESMHPTVAQFIVFFVLSNARANKATQRELDQTR